MYVEEAAALFRTWVDERDETFLTPANVATFLKLAYSELRNKWSQVDTGAFETIVDFQVTNARVYDFADPASPVRLLGNPAGGLTGPRLQRICEIVQPAPGAWPYDPVTWVGVQNLTQLSQTTAVYMFSGTKLYFAQDINYLFRMRYIGEPTGPDWTKQAVGDNEIIDDNEQWHDLIPLLAAQRYSVADQGTNQQLQAMLATRLQEFQHFIYLGRDAQASTRVQVTYNP